MTRRYIDDVNLPNDYDANFGPCCACGGRVDVANIIMLSRKAPTPGTGWGCFQCGLPMDGAMAVLCDACIETKAEIKFVCAGYITDPRRIPYAELLGAPYEHDLSKHPEAKPPNQKNRRRS